MRILILLIVIWNISAVTLGKDKRFQSYLNLAIEKTHAETTSDPSTIEEKTEDDDSRSTKTEDDDTSSTKTEDGDKDSTSTTKNEDDNGDTPTSTKTDDGNDKNTSTTENNEESNCREYYEDKTKGCEKCSHGYYKELVDDKTYECKKCKTGCLTCSEPEKCASCPSKYYLKDGSCHNCPKNCKECKDSETCLTDDIPLGQDKQPDGLRICEVQHCSRCETDIKTCDECFDGTFLADKTTCSSCPDTCETCTSSNKCTKCNDSNNLDQGKCEKPSKAYVLWLVGGFFVLGFICIGFIILTTDNAQDSDKNKEVPKYSPEVNQNDQNNSISKNNQPMGGNFKLPGFAGPNAANNINSYNQQGYQPMYYQPGYYQGGYAQYGPNQGFEMNKFNAFNPTNF